MDIKSLARAILPLSSPLKVDGNRQTKLESTDDRDANGQMPQGDQQENRRNLSSEELQEAIEYLKGLAGVKDNNLTVRLECKDGINVVYIQEPNGKVVRRIPETELAQLTKNREKKSGHLLDKAM